MPDGTNIMHSPAGDVTKHDSAVPTFIIPLGHDDAANTMSGSIIAIYPVGHDVDGAAACAADIPMHPKNKNNIFFM